LRELSPAHFLHISPGNACNCHRQKMPAAATADVRLRNMRNARRNMVFHRLRGGSNVVAAHLRVMRPRQTFMSDSLHSRMS
jgi:hypothetical protein